MDTTNPVIQLCIAGTQAEFAHRNDEASELYQQAWEAASDDYEACIAAHYVARMQEDAIEKLRWNQESLIRAKAVGDERVQEFFPSLYLSLGQSHEALGDQINAQKFYDLAAQLGFPHQAGPV